MRFNDSFTRPLYTIEPDSKTLSDSSYSSGECSLFKTLILPFISNNKPLQSPILAQNISVFVIKQIKAVLPAVEFPVLLCQISSIFSYPISEQISKSNYFRDVFRAFLYCYF